MMKNYIIKGNIIKNIQLPPNVKLTQVCENGKVVWEDPVEMFKVNSNKILDKELKDSDLKDAKDAISKFMLKR